jgi:hypothetical protein
VCLRRASCRPRGAIVLEQDSKKKRVDLKGHDFTKADEKFLEKFLGIVKKRFSWPKSEHIEHSTDFSFQTQFCNLFEFSANKIHSKNIYLPHLSSENCEINFIKSDSPNTLQQHQENTPKFQYSFQF